MAQGLQDFKLAARTRRCRLQTTRRHGTTPKSVQKAETLNLLYSHLSMRRTAVDDVQGSCYYQTVPRVKSGLPVYGSPVGKRNPRCGRLREDFG
jgi:hypothetical protein